MRIRGMRKWGLLLVAGGMSGCVAVQTEVIKEAPVRKDTARSRATAGRDGLIYRLPKQALIVTLTVNADGRKVTVGSTPAYADMEYAFVAQYQRSQLTTNTLSFSVDSQGLLTGKMSAKVEPLVLSVLKTLEQKTQVRVAEKPSGAFPKCSKAGVYTWVIQVPAELDELAKPKKDCDLIVEPPSLMVVKKNTDPEKMPLKGSVPADGKYGGVFYRQAIPYRVTTQLDQVVQQNLVVMVTRDSPIEYIPFQYSLFATNDLKLSFKDGTPTDFDQAIDSEWSALLTLPAKVFKAYFEAIGGVLSARKTGLTNEKDLLAAEMQYEQQKAKAAICAASLSSNQLDTIKTACSQ